MPDTKIKREPTGWIDVDDPATYYRVRREARAARRLKRMAANPQNLKNVTQRAANSLGITATKKASTVTIIDSDPDALTSLQEKLLARLTKVQGVAEDDALDIIKNNGYNKAASYGHMRAAGATHSEARIVIALSQPDVSIAYGKNRANGFKHTDALREALQDANHASSSTYPY